MKKKPKAPAGGPVATEVREVAIATISVDADAARRGRADAGDARMKELVESMKAQGLITPIGVTAQGKKFRLVFGHRRLAAAIELGWDSILASVYPPLSDEMVFDLRLLENLMRKDLSPMEEAALFGQLHVGPKRAPGLTIAEISARVGKSETYVRQRLDLLRLDKALHPFVASGRIPIAHACLIARIGDKSEHVKFAKQVVGMGYGPTLAKAGKSDFVLPLGRLRQELQTAMRPLGGAGWPWDERYAGKRPCQGCPNNTATDPALFEGIPIPGKSKKGNCTARACYVVKSMEWDKAVNARRKADAKAGQKPKPRAEKKAARVQGHTPAPFPDPKSKHYAVQVHAVRLWEYGDGLARAILAHAKSKGMDVRAVLSAACQMILSYDGSIYLDVRAPLTAMPRLAKVFASRRPLELDRDQAARLLKMAMSELVGHQPIYAASAPLSTRRVAGIKALEALAKRWKVTHALIPTLKDIEAELTKDKQPAAGGKADKKAPKADARKKRGDRPRRRGLRLAKAPDPA